MSISEGYKDIEQKKDSLERRLDEMGPSYDEHMLLRRIFGDKQIDDWVSKAREIDQQRRVEQLEWERVRAIEKERIRERRRSKEIEIER